MQGNHIVFVGAATFTDFDTEQIVSDYPQHQLDGRKVERLTISAWLETPENVQDLIDWLEITKESLR